MVIKVPSKWTCLQHHLKMIPNSATVETSFLRAAIPKRAVTHSHPQLLLGAVEAEAPIRLEKDAGCSTYCV